MLKEFKSFLVKGNAVDIAVGFVFGAAFATLVKGIVTNLFMPFVGLIMGKIDFSQMFVSLSGSYDTLKEAEEAAAPVVKYGLVITDIINFIILGLIIFMMVKAINKMNKKEEEKKEAKKADDVVLLEEIRDVLKSK